MKKKNQGLTQKQRLGQKLKQISVDVSTKDRAAYMADEEPGITKQTLSKYLNGDVADADRAIKMISFFQIKIKEREAVIL